MHRLQGILKNPAFNPHKEADIVGLLTALRTVTPYGIGNERKQLEATLTSCTSELSLGQFISADAERMAFLSTDEKLSRMRLRLKPDGTVPIVDVASRSYEIRCRIVHAKAESGGTGDMPPLLPFAKEQWLMSDDLALMDFICVQILIATSTPFDVD